MKKKKEIIIIISNVKKKLAFSFPSCVWFIFSFHTFFSFSLKFMKGFRFFDISIIPQSMTCLKIFLWTYTT